MRFFLLLAAAALVPAAAQSSLSYGDDVAPDDEAPYSRSVFNSDDIEYIYDDMLHAPPPPPPIPIDGGLGLLALAGGALAVRKLRANR